MPQASTITLNDGQATPVGRAFAPRSISTPQAIFKYAAQSTSAGDYELILGLAEPQRGGTVYRVPVKINMPIEHTVDGVVQIAHTLRFSGEFLIPRNATLANKEDLMAFTANAMDHADVVGYVENQEPVWG